MRRLCFALLLLWGVHLPATALTTNNIHAALQQTLSGLQTGRMAFAPRAIYHATNKERFQHCENNGDFNASFKGFARLIAYYLLFRKELEGVYPYATTESQIYNDKTQQWVNIVPLDTLIKNVDFDTLRQWALQALRNLTPPAQQYLYHLALHFQRTYKTFSQTLTPEIIAALEQQDTQNYFDFSVLGFPQPPDCFAERFYTAEVSGKGIFDREKTYFSIGSMDDYLYGFWWRRYHNGTINEVKELLNDVLLFFENNKPAHS